MPLDRATALIGSLLGQALGDALGFVVEAKPPELAGAYVKDCLLAGRAGEISHPDWPFGQYTDDTQLARELVHSVVDAGCWRPDAFAQRIAALFAEERDVGAGPGTRGAAARLLAGTPWREAGTPAPYAGNGSAMRAIPVGVLFGSDTRAMVQVAAEQSATTHADPRCTAGAIAVAGAAALAARSPTIVPLEFLDALAELTAPVDDFFTRALLGLRRWNHLAPADAARRLHAEGLDPAFRDEWQGISAFVVPSVVWSLYAFLRSPDDYWATVCSAIAVGGDTDTMAAIAGGLAGARLGPDALPADLVARVNDRGEWGSGLLTDLAREAARLVGD